MLKTTPRNKQNKRKHTANKLNKQTNKQTNLEGVPVIQLQVLVNVKA